MIATAATVVGGVIAVLMVVRWLTDSKVQMDTDAKAGKFTFTLDRASRAEQ
jgi:hypothetical protein